MKNTKQRTAFFGTWAAGLAASLLIMGLLTACPNAAGGGNNSDGGSGEEIVFSYTEVPYGDLADYLAAASSDVNYIEIMGAIPKGDFKGTFDGSNREPGKFGKKIKDAADKKVALKLPSEVAELTDMSWCFAGCTNLVSVANIPEPVTNLTECFLGCTSLTQAPVIPPTVESMMNTFYGCTSLTKAPVIPSSVTFMWGAFADCTSLTQAPIIPSNVTNMFATFAGCTKLTQGPDIPGSVTGLGQCFSDCSALKRVKLNCKYSDTPELAFEGVFKNCTALEKGGIKVMVGQYEKYTAAAALTKMAVPGEDDETKKAKFSKF